MAARSRCRWPGSRGSSMQRKPSAAPGSCWVTERAFIGRRSTRISALPVCSAALPHPWPRPDQAARIRGHHPVTRWWEWRRWGAALALGVAIFALLLALAGRTPLWAGNEPRFAQATFEMIASGDYLVPTFNGSLRPDKPILAYWWMALPMRL